MKNKDYILYPLAGVILALLIIFVLNYLKSQTGNGFTIESIINSDKPYTCTFEKMDESSTISGTIHTNNQKLFGEFKIKTDLETKEFNSFLIIKDNKAYVWTSLQPSGYISSIAKSSSVNSSPQDQAQIIGTEDRLPYVCEPWQNADNALFEIPTSTKFVELKN
jgi:hypothetical protein